MYASASERSGQGLGLWGGCLEAAIAAGGTAAGSGDKSSCMHASKPSEVARTHSKPYALRYRTNPFNALSPKEPSKGAPASAGVLNFNPG